MIDTAPVTAPIETVTPIKPSEALRLGRLVRPLRIEGRLFRGTNGACALGAIAVGFGWPDAGLNERLSRRSEAAIYEFIERQFPDAGRYWVDHISLSNDSGYSDKDILLSLEAAGL